MMNKKQKKLRKLQFSVSLTNQSLAGMEREDPQKEPVTPFPDIPIFPDLPCEKPFPTHPENDINEHDINDPTRTDEFPPIFN